MSTYAIVNRRLFLQGIAAVGAGILLPLALAPFDLPLFDLASIAALYFLLDRVSARRAALLGWCFGLGKYGLGVSWVYVSIHDYGHASPVLAGGLVALFVAVLALFPAIMAFAYTWFRARTGIGASPLGRACVFAAFWVGLEWLLTWFLTGFPWLYVGYAHLQDPLRHWAPVGGVLMVSLVAALSAVGVVEVIRVAHARVRLAALLLVAAPWLLGSLFGALNWVETARSGRVALVQGNIPQDFKWVDEHTLGILDTYRRLSEGHWNADIVIWPEAAITLFEHQAGAFLDEIDSRARNADSSLVLGLPAIQFEADGSASFLNSARVLGNGEGRYVKRRLVPFGEYVPFESMLRGVIRLFDLPMSRAVSGPSEQPVLEAGGFALAMSICYEVVYPDLVRSSAAAADLLVTLSNDAWFGGSIGPHQHMQMARMRAIENGRWLLRATNNGITAIVDPRGRVTARLPQFEEGVLEGEFASSVGVTPYTRFGDVPVLILLVAMLVLPVFARRRTARLGRLAREIARTRDGTVPPAARAFWSRIAPRSRAG